MHIQHGLGFSTGTIPGNTRTQRPAQPPSGAEGRGARVWDAEYTVLHDGNGTSAPDRHTGPNTVPPAHQAVPYSESLSARRALQAFLTHDQPDRRGRAVDLFA